MSEQALILRPELRKMLGDVSSETLRVWIKTGKVPPPDTVISQRTNGWHRSTLRAAGIPVPDEEVEAPPAPIPAKPMKRRVLRVSPSPVECEPAPAAPERILTGRHVLTPFWRRYGQEVSEQGLLYKIFRRGPDYELRRPRLLPADADECFCPGVYLMILDGRVAYVGQAAVTVTERIHWHRQQFWNRLAVIKAPPWWHQDHFNLWLNLMEYHAYERFRPSNNAARIYGYGEPNPLIAKAFDLLPDDWGPDIPTERLYT